MTTKKNQVEKFKKVARELGVDEDEAAFDEKLAAIAGQKANRGEPMTKEPKTSGELKTLLDEGIQRFILGRQPEPQWTKIIPADPAKDGANWKVSHSSRTVPSSDFSKAIKRVTAELQKLYDLIPEKP